MAAEPGILARTPLAIKVLLVVLILALGVVATPHFLAARCPSYIIKRNGICFYVYDDVAGNRVEQQLSSCPIGC